MLQMAPRAIFIVLSLIAVQNTCNCSSNNNKTNYFAVTEAEMKLASNLFYGSHGMATSLFLLGSPLGFLFYAASGHSMKAGKTGMIIMGTVPAVVTFLGWNLVAAPAITAAGAIPALTADVAIDGVRALVHGAQKIMTCFENARKKNDLSKLSRDPWSKDLNDSVRDFSNLVGDKLGWLYSPKAIEKLLIFYPSEQRLINVFYRKSTDELIFTAQNVGMKYQTKTGKVVEKLFNLVVACDLKFPLFLIKKVECDTQIFLPEVPQNCLHSVKEEINSLFRGQQSNSMLHLLTANKDKFPELAELTFDQIKQSQKYGACPVLKTQ